ncbi:hypothetical protein [Nitrospira moscoviensis]|jgi:hypothetical protein|uniref:Outer membrane protein beta-barrel domain-containing protein n=1 Tax=Nitrospira moscoviensis TaxID=42253 RepID=A0A0K2GHF4_NITMO|nr:hypothetical protein [Nitrospira moscoviensis]ALA60366.1 conserved exported protein of unknown function [Nitrospira moscoviensis]
MQVRARRGRSIGAKCAAVAIVLALGVCGVWPASAEETGNMVVFKGGFMRLDSDRSNALFTDARNPLGEGLNNSQGGWYVGAWLDQGLTKDAWGLLKGTWVVGEIGLQFNRISSKVVTNTNNIGVGTSPPAGLQVTSTNPSLQQLTMVTIDIAPKLKFMEGSAFRPWLIPVGLDIHVISPPSNQTQYLDVGVQFGAGFEYAVWKAIRLGMDARYHVTANMTNTTNSYMQVGPYVGIAF